MADNRKQLRYVILLAAMVALIFPGQVNEALAVSSSASPAAPAVGGRLAPAAQVADPIVVDFDQDASGTDIPHATLIDEQYASLGIHFQGGFSAVRRSQCFPDYKTTTSLNLLNTFASADADPLNCGPLPRSGISSKVVVLLDFPVDYASIEGRTSADGQRDTDLLTLNAFDADGVLRATDTVIGSNVPPTYTTEGVLVPQVCAQGIRRLEVSPQLTESLDTLTLREAATPDLVLSQDDGQTSVMPGQVLTYTLTISNAGNQVATGVTISDTLPAHTSFVAASHEGSESEGVVTWPGFDLMAGAEVSRTLSVRVDDLLPAGVEAITNTASVTDDGSNCPDPTPEGNSASDVDVVDSTPDLALGKDDGQASAMPGQVLTYTLTISNAGSQDATGVLVTDTLPVYTSFVDASHGGVQVADVVTWPDFDLPAGLYVTRTLSVQVDGPLPAGVEVISNTASVTDDGSNGDDPTPEDNTASDTDSLEAAPDLTLQKDDGQASATPGQVLTYLLIISNVGNQNATGVLVTDTLPAYTSFVDASHGGVQATQVVTWPGFNLPAGFYVTRTLSVRVDDLLPAEAEAITNTATVTDDGSNGADLTPENNVASDTDSLSGAIDLRLNKDDGHTSVAPGGVVTYTLTYTNAGRQGATGVIITDTVPASTTFHAGGSSAGWSCNDGDPAGSVCTFPIGGLNAGAGGTAAFAVRAADPLPEDLTHIVNNASVGDDGRHGPDQNAGDNRASDSTPTSFTWIGFCNLYPIALDQSLLPGAEGQIIENMFNGTQPGNFGWLSWTGDMDVPSLVTSLTPPGDGDAYINPDDPADHVVSPGDWVIGRTGVPDANAVRQALDTLTGLDMVVPVWDATQGTGSNTHYRVANFARIHLANYQLAPDNRISAEFLGYMQCAGGGMLELSPQVAIGATSDTFSDTVRIHYAAQPPMITDPFQNIGLFFDLDASYLDGSPAQPGKPYSLTVAYDPADVLPGVNERSLALYFWAADTWIRETSSQVDPPSHTLTAQPDHFSLWAALARGRALYLPLILKGGSSPPESRSTE